MKNQELKEATIFFLVVIFLSYFVFWGPIAFFKVPTVNLVEGSLGPVWAIALFIIGGFVPSIIGITLTGIFEGKTGVKELIKKSLQIKIGFKWLSVILLVSTYFALSLIALYTYLDGKFDYSQFLVQLPTILPLIILGPLSEEYGWRGFAIKRLLKYTNANLASLVIGLVWSLWHLPLFFMLGTAQYEFQMPYLAFIISVTSISFIYTYLYIKAKQSLFSAILFHWIYTYVIQVVSTSIVRTELYSWFEPIPSLLIGLIFVFILHKEKFAIKSAESSNLPLD